LRAKIDDPHPAKLIHTIRGVGYMIDTPERTEKTAEPAAGRQA
jgi:Holliday junction resolvasome RuvABC DNA-binding subunit